MRSIAITCGVLALLFATTPLRAQEAPSGFPAPQKEHEWLKQFVGEWVSEAEASFGPGQPSVKCQGTMNARMLGGFWVVNEAKSSMMGTETHAIQTIGYDPETQQYIGTWVDSMTSYQWNYKGSVDESGKILTLEADGPNFFEEGKMAKYRDSYEFKSKDHFIAKSSMLGPDGKWITFMTGEVRRKK